MYCAPEGRQEYICTTLLEDRPLLQQKQQLLLGLLKRNPQGENGRHLHRLRKIHRHRRHRGRGRHYRRRPRRVTQ